MDPLVWAFSLLAIGLIFVSLEFVIPSGGILGVLAAIALLSGIVMAFYARGLAVGFGFVVITLFSVPLILTAGFKVLPFTPFGKELLAEPPNSDEVLSDLATRRHLRDLEGRIGRAITAIIPSGLIEVEGMEMDAVSQGMPIQPNTPIVVVDIQGTRIVVRPYSPSEEQASVNQLPATNLTKSAVASTPTNEMLFEQSLENLGIEDWDKPKSP